jgi:broad specificity phosphatase PhoE
LTSVLVGSLLGAAVHAQVWEKTPGVGGDRIRYAVQVPPDFSYLKPEQWVPVVVLFVQSTDPEVVFAAARDYGGELAKEGFVTVCPMRESKKSPDDASPLLLYSQLFAQLRRTFLIEQGALHAAAGAGAAEAIPEVLAHASEFQTFTAFGPGAKADLSALRRLPARRVYTFESSEPAALAAHLQKVHAERALKGTAGEVARVLDDFHDAAAKSDAKRYFAILPEDAVFLGTDGTERWTGTEFRAYAMPYFERGQGWTYACLSRHVDVEPGATFAWFDERFDNAAYGECRGSGVLCKRDGRWVLRQYNLTVPLPNELAQGFAARIRAFREGHETTTTVVLVRHAEKESEGFDPPLSAAGRARAESLARALRDLPITAAYATEFKRTSQTVAPVCAARGIEVETIDASKTETVAAKVRARLHGETVLVCGHSNTVPAIIKALGVLTKVTIDDDEFDRLFVVTLEPDGARVLSLRYAAGAPLPLPSGGK